MQYSSAPASLALRASGLFKRFGAICAVSGISLDVAAGECMGLLGPNGAGKSTTLAMLAGLETPDGGSVSVLGAVDPTRPEVRRRLGFVPQQIALYPELTVNENLMFFGRVHGLRGAALGQSVASALEFARLEDRRGAFVGNLSGGMQRRLNLACSTLHAPAVLLLDEPTVGVDRASRAHLFDCILALKRRGTALVYCTHYLEEAEQLCDRVAIVDAGRIVAQGTPVELCQRYGAQNVLRARVHAPPPGLGLPGLVPAGSDWITLRCADVREGLEQLLELGLEVRELSVQPARLEHVLAAHFAPGESPLVFRWGGLGVVWCIAAKDLRALLRDRMALFWVLGFPLVFAVFLAAVLEAGLGGNVSKLSVALAGEAQHTERLRAALAQSAQLSLVEQSPPQAEDSVRRGDVVAALFVAADSAVRSDRAEAVRPRVSILVDPAHALDGERVRAEVLRALAESLAAEAPASASNALGGLMRPDEWVSVRRLVSGTAPRTAADYVFAPAVLWGLIGCAACFAISLVAERTRGTLRRLAAAPISRRSILLGKALACGLACLCVAGLITLVMALGFSVSFPAPGKLLLALFSTAACFSGITMLLSVLGKSEQSVAGAGWGTLIVLAMLGGGMVPLSLMPPWLTELGRFSPVHWGIVALEGALWRGFSYAELLQRCALLVALGLGCFGTGSLLLRRAFRYS